MSNKADISIRMFSRWSVCLILLSLADLAETVGQKPYVLIFERPCLVVLVEFMPVEIFRFSSRCCSLFLKLALLSMPGVDVMLEHADCPDPGLDAAGSMSSCFRGVRSLCLVHMLCPRECCACLYFVLASTSDKIVDVDVEVELEVVDLVRC